MPYEKPAHRANPGCIIFIVDQSNSMLDPFAGTQRSKAEAVATALNRFFADMIASCERGEDKPRHFFDVAAIGYTTDDQGNPIVGSLFGGDLAGRDIVSVVELYDNPLAIEKRKKKEAQDDGAGGTFIVETEVDFPVWYRVPESNKMYGTPMGHAFRYASLLADDWARSHMSSFPPVIIHLTDGEPTDDNPSGTVEAEAERLRSVATDDGEALLFNCHLSHQTTDPVMFPGTDGVLPDDYSKMLYRMSSALPEKLRQRAEIRGISAPPGCRGLVYNADGARMLLLIDLGTPVDKGPQLPSHLR